MRYLIITIYILAGIALSQGMAEELHGNGNSRITSVKLYTNMAEVTRTTTLSLKRGSNKFILHSLPDNLYDWSVKGVLPKFFGGKIMSMEVSRKKLLEKRRKKIVAIEKKLEELRERDLKLRDDLENIKSNEKFLNSIGQFSSKLAAKELANRTPNFASWTKTSKYLTDKREAVQKSRRKILKQRKELAKKIQKLEFDLNQIAGNEYYRNYLRITRSMAEKTDSSVIQQYDDIAGQYVKRNNFLYSPNSSLDTEKRIVLSVYSPYAKSVDFKFSYLVPGTAWDMKYDFRASQEDKNMEVTVFSNIYQNTGEDWTNIDLTLSTGSPMRNISVPRLYPWYLSAYTPHRRMTLDYAAKEVMVNEMEESKSHMKYNRKKASPKIAERGVNFAINFPGKVTLESSSKYRKKHLRSYKVEEGQGLRFFYRVIPAKSDRAFVMAEVQNKTTLPWLRGGAQIFLDNELSGKTTISRTPRDKKIKMVLGMDSQITAKKELVKKYEDKSGLFGGERKLIYSYRLTVENSSRESKEVTLLDNFPVSQNSKIKVEIKNLSHEFINDKKTKGTKDFIRGIRKFKLNLAPGQKTEIKYNAVISFDKELQIRGLR